MRDSLVCALCQADSPDIRMSALFCVTAFRTREFLPCDAKASILLRPKA